MILARKRKILAAAGGTKPFNGLVSTVGLVSHWTLNESSGTRMDSVGTNNLTVTGSPTSVAGKINNSVGITNGSDLRCASNASLQTGDIDFTISGWAKGDGFICSKDDFGAGREFFVQLASNLSFSIPPATVADLTTPTNSSTWYFFVAWRDKATNTLKIQVNNGAVQSSPGTAGPLGSAPFVIGAILGIGGFTGTVDEVSLFKRVLTADERTALYNSGNGLAYLPPPVLTYQQQIVADGATAYWPLDDASGTTARDLVGTRHGTISGGVTLNQTGVGGGKAMDFNGTTGFIDLASTPIAVPQFSYEAWVYCRTPPGTQMSILGRNWNMAGGSSFERVELAGGAFRLQIPGLPPANVAGSPRAINTWYHVVVTHDGTTARLYVNGVADGSTTPFVLNVGDTGLPARIGSLDPYGIFWDGLLQDVAIYPRALSPAEVTSHYAKRLNLSPLQVGLVSYWKLEETSGNRLDSHGTNHLTPTNAPIGAAGKVGNGCNFVRASSQYLTPLDSGLTGDEDFTYTVWFKRQTLTGDQMIFGKDSNVTPRAYTLAVVAPNNRVQWAILPGGWQFSYSVPVNDTNWHFAVAGYDATANLMFLQIDNGPEETLAATVGPLPYPETPFRIGARAYAGFSDYFDGIIDEVGFWKRVLTPAERTELYNAGAGKTYPFA